MFQKISGQSKSAARLAEKSLAGMVQMWIGGIHHVQMTKHARQGIPAGFQTQGRRH